MKTALIGYLYLSMTSVENPDRRAVTHAVEDFRNAMVEVNEIALSTMTSKNLSYGHSNGFVENQATFIASLVSGKYRFLSIELDEQTIDVIDSIAIVRHRFFAHTADMSKPQTTVNLHVLTVWRKTDGKWLLVARQAVKI